MYGELQVSTGAGYERWVSVSDVINTTRMKLPSLDAACLDALRKPYDARTTLIDSAPVNEFCPLSEDVCAFPTGDRDAKMAVRALMLEDKSDDCIQKFSAFMCALHFPPCRFRVTIPLCYQDCMDTHTVCILQVRSRA